MQRVLDKMDGVKRVEIDLKSQKVTVTVEDSVTPQAVFDTVAKAGKKTEFWA